MTSASRTTSSERPPVPHRGSTTLWALVAPAVVVAIAASLSLSWRDELPDPVATHFGPSGEPDNFGEVVPHVVAPSIIVMVFAAGMWALGFFVGRAAVVRRLSNALAVWFAVVLMGSIAGSLAQQRGLEDAAQAPDTGGVTAVVFVAATVLAAVSAWLTPGDRPQPTSEPVPADAPTLALTEHEHATWVREVGQAGILATSAGMLALTVALAAYSGMWWILLIGGIVAATLTAVVRWTVVVDHEGLTVRSAYRRPRVRVPLDEVLRAEEVSVRPLREFGGWGMRVGTGGRVGVVVRRGPGLQVERTGGRLFVVTVDDAATGAALLNTLAARTRGVATDGR